MTTVSLITPSYSRDFEQCKLLCESVDRHLSGYQRHRLIVHDEDVPLFQPLASARRVVEPVSHYIPRWLHQVPSSIRVRGRIWWISLRAPPVHGWHVQQMVKFQAAASLPHDVAVFLDSDAVFVRDFDVAAWAGGARTPFLRDPGALTETMTNHAAWLATAHRLLGLDAPTLPASDYIGHIIAWRKDTVTGLLARIERTTGQPWVQALCRNRKFSEYILYGCHVDSDAAGLARHAPIHSRVCQSHWSDAALDNAGLSRLIAGLAPDQVAIAVQSFGGTPAAVIRDALHWTGAARISRI